MSAATLEKIRLEAESLSVHEKEKLINFLSESIYSPQEIEGAWIDEAERRMSSAEAGTSGFKNWDDIKPKYEKYFERLKTAR